MEIVKMVKDVKQTTDYSQFRIGEWNREISEKSIKKIEKSVEKRGWLKHPIIVNEDFVIIDGQHRYEFAKRNNLPVYYMVVPNLGVEDCVTMNNSRTGWSLYDYIRFYAGQGSPDYIILENMVKDYYFLPVSTLVGIVTDSSQSGGTTAKVKNGDFVITAKEHDKAITKLEMLKRIQRQVLAIPGRASAMFMAISCAYDCEGVDVDRLEKQIQMYFNMVTPPANQDMALQEVEKVYNYRNNRGRYAYIYEEYKRKALEKMSRKRKGED